MATNINVCVIGEVSSGKTSLVSVIINQIAGVIKMKRSTLNYIKFVEQLTDIKQNNQQDMKNTDQKIKCDTIHINPIKCLEYKRPYLFNIYDRLL